MLALVTTTSRREVEWITRDVGRIFPREWDRFATAVPDASRHLPLADAYATLLFDPDPAVRDEAARCSPSPCVPYSAAWLPSPLQSHVKRKNRVGTADVAAVRSVSGDLNFRYNASLLRCSPIPYYEGRYAAALSCGGDRDAESQSYYPCG